ncbi:MAG TPA: UDP-glucose 4-epimerase GalE [Ktedonobacterales bacterium]|nr:UDP-glucose 4-epimerase GalE [Ktedonobacterales bacterium]
MRTLVTGGAGYIGSVIVEELRRQGHTPIVFDSFVKGHRAALPVDVTVVEGDIRDTALLTETMARERVEAVIHMVGLIEVGLSATNPAAFFETNVGGSMSVVRAMIETGVTRLVFSSTAAVYAADAPLPLREDAATGPTSAYGASKLMVEQMLQFVAPVHGLICTALRYFNAAGATERNGEAHEPETHLIPLVLRAAERNEPVTIYGTDYPTPDGTGVRDYIHVRDLASAHLLALGRTEPGVTFYNVGSGVGYSVRQVIEMAREVTGRDLQVIVRPRRPGDQPATVATSERIVRELGWQPQHSDLRTLISTAWAWRQAHPNGYASA